MRRTIRFQAIDMLADLDKKGVFNTGEDPNIRSGQPPLETCDSNKNYNNIQGRIGYISSSI